MSATDKFLDSLKREIYILNQRFGQVLLPHQGEMICRHAARLIEEARLAREQQDPLPTTCESSSPDESKLTEAGWQ